MPCNGPATHAKDIGISSDLTYAYFNRGVRLLRRHFGISESLKKCKAGAKHTSRSAEHNAKIGAKTKAAWERRKMAAAQIYPPYQAMSASAGT